MRYVGWDKDGVLADHRHRLWMVDEVKAGRMSWLDFASACADDKVIESSVALMRLLQTSQYRFSHVVMSGSTACPQAWDWLEDSNIPYDLAFFRPEGDESTSSGMLKAQWIKQFQAQGHEFALFFEDVPEIAEVIRRETGVPVIVVNPCFQAPVGLPLER